MMNISKYHSAIKWLFNYRVKGIPFHMKENDKYVDWHLNYRNRLIQFKDKHKGQDCFIIGNGPSLNKMDLTKLNNYYTFGLNKIFLIFEKQRIDLSYLVSVNHLVIKQSLDIYENVIDFPIFISYLGLDGYVPKSDYIYPLYTHNTWSFYKDIANPICEGYTVTYVAMQIAYYMGFKNVFLIGVDHNFIQKGNPNEEQKYIGDDQNHFHPDYFKGLNWHLADMEGNEASYSLAKHQYHTDNRKIYDATLDGKLDIFTKIPFEDALRIAKKKSKA